MSINIGIKRSNATFVSEGMPDTTVQVLTGLNPSFAINFGGTNNISVPYIPQDRDLQLTEALQFVADTIGATVPGRLTSFTRGWISTAADAHHKAEFTYRANNPLAFDHIADAIDDARNSVIDEDMGAAEAFLAEAVIGIMGLGHDLGIKIPQLVEAMLNRE